MKISNNYISIFLSAIVACGISLSATHMHNQLSDSSGLEVTQLVDFEVCIICTSLQKPGHTDQTALLIQFVPESNLFSVPDHHIKSSFGDDKRGRAPPSLS